MSIFIKILIFLAVGFLTYKLIYIIHELGHLISAIFIGWKAIFTQFGKYGLYKRVGGWSFEKKDYAQYNTLIIFPVKIKDRKFLLKYLLMMISGYISNILFIGLLILFLHKFNGLVKYLLFTATLVSFLVLLQTLRYAYNNEGVSDSLIVKLLISKATRKEMLTILLYKNEIFKDIKYYEDIESNLFSKPKEYKLPVLSENLDQDLYMIIELIIKKINIYLN